MSTKDKLEELNHVLTDVHRDLLHFQKTIEENKIEHKISSYEMLHMTINHPDFEWLRKISVIIAGIDEVLDDKNQSEITDFYLNVRKELYEIFNDPDLHPDFKLRIDIALMDPQLCLRVISLRQLLKN